MALQTLTRQEFLDAIKTMKASDLDWLVPQVIRARAERRSAVLSAEESSLLTRINQMSFPAEVQTRYKMLIDNLEDESLTDAEHQELMGLAKMSDQLAVLRLELVAKLANLRKTTVADVVKQLGLEASSYA